jgi:hypothetical protein
MVMTSEPPKIEVGSNVRLNGLDGPGMVVAKVQQGTAGVTHAAMCWRYVSVDGDPETAIDQAAGDLCHWKLFAQLARGNVADQAHVGIVNERG